MNKKNRKKGFTLVELVVVIAIIAILGAVSVVGYLGFVKNANKSALEQEAIQLKTVVVAGLADKDNAHYSYDKEEDAAKTSGAAEKDIDDVMNYYFAMTGTKKEGLSFTYAEAARDPKTAQEDDLVYAITLTSIKDATITYTFNVSMK